MDRFNRQSDTISIRKLERESYRLLGTGFLFGVILQVVLGFLVTAGRAPSPLPAYVTVDIVVRPPRPNRPFAVHNQVVTRRLMRRSPFLPVAPEVETFSRMRPEPPISDIFSREYTVSEPLSTESEADMPIETDYEKELRERFGYAEHIERRPSRLFSFRDEMLSVENFEAANDGRIKGLVFYNPDDRYTIRGIVSLPHFSSAEAAPRYLSMGINELAEAMETYTDVAVLHHDMRYLYHNREFNYPFIYIALGREWEYFPFEADSIGNYLKNGGFAVFENLNPGRHFSPGEASLRQFIRDALGVYARFRPIPNDHALYHCFFDFDDGPPLGVELSDARYVPIPYLEGIWIGDRLAAIYSNKGYGVKWASRENNEPHLRMGVNMVVYALRQSGGKAEQFVDFNLTPGLKIKRWNVALTAPQEW